jgi:hypothetical protein
MITFWYPKYANSKCQVKLNNWAIFTRLVASKASRWNDVLPSNNCAKMGWISNDPETITVSIIMNWLSVAAIGCKRILQWRHSPHRSLIMKPMTDSKHLKSLPSWHGRLPKKASRIVCECHYVYISHSCILRKLWQQGCVIIRQLIIFSIYFRYPYASGKFKHTDTGNFFR